MNQVLRDFLSANYPRVLEYPESVQSAVAASNYGPFRLGCNYERFQEIWVRRSSYSPILWAGKKVLVVGHSYTLNHPYRNYFYTVVGLDEPVVGATRRFQNQYLTDLEVEPVSFTPTENSLSDLLVSYSMTKERANLEVLSLIDSCMPSVRNEAVAEQLVRFRNLWRLPDFDRIISTNVFAFSILVGIKRPKFTVRVHLGYPGVDSYLVKAFLVYPVRRSLFNVTEQITPEIAGWFDKLLTDHTVEVELPKRSEFDPIKTKYHMEETPYMLIRHAN